MRASIRSKIHHFDDPEELSEREFCSFLTQALELTHATSTTQFDVRFEPMDVEEAVLEYTVPRTYLRELSNRPQYRLQY